MNRSLLLRRLALSVAGTASLCVVGCERTPVEPNVVWHDAVRFSVAHDTPETFEAFTPGPVYGQGDWLSLSGPLGTPCAVYDHAIVDNATWPAPRRFGRRSLRISNAVTSGCYSDQTFSQRAADAAGQAGAVTTSRDGRIDYALPGGTLRNHFEARMTFASTMPEAQQPGLEVVVSAGRGDDLRMSWVQLSDLADGVAITFADRADPADPGAINRTLLPMRLDRRVPHAVRLTMDFVDGPTNDAVRLYVDGDLVHTGGSWETYYALDPNGRLNFGGNPPAVNRLMFRTGSDAHRGIPGTAAPATRGKGFAFDDVEVSSWSVPHSAADCKRDGWRALRDPDGHGFRNQGGCVRSLRRDAVDGDRDNDE